MLRKPSLAHYLTRSLLYGFTAAFLLAIGLLVWQAAVIRDAPHQAHADYVVSAGPFTLITINKGVSGGNDTATFALGNGWPGYLLTCLLGSLAIGMVAWKYTQARARKTSADSHTLSGGTDV